MGKSSTNIAKRCCLCIARQDAVGCTFCKSVNVWSRLNDTSYFATDAILHAVAGYTYRMHFCLKRAGLVMIISKTHYSHV